MRHIRILFLFFALLISAIFTTPAKAITKVSSWQCPEPPFGKQLALFAFTSVDNVFPYDDAKKASLLQYCVELYKAATNAPFSAFSPTPFATPLDKLTVTKEKTSCTDVKKWDNVGPVTSFGLESSVTELCKNYIGPNGILNGGGPKDVDIEKHVRYKITSDTGNTYYLYFFTTKVSPFDSAPGSCWCMKAPIGATQAPDKAEKILELKTESTCADQTLQASDGVYELTSCKWVADSSVDPNVPASSANTSGAPLEQNYVLEISDYKRPADYEGPLPDCAFDGSCRDVNDLVQLLINVGEKALGYIGMIAFVFFIYGGFMMIISMGNAERVKKGREILVAAVVGIVISFSAYALVSFFLNTLGVTNSDFRAIDGAPSVQSGATATQGSATTNAGGGSTGGGTTANTSASTASVPTCEEPTTQKKLGNTESKTDPGLAMKDGPASGSDANVILTIPEGKIFEICKNSKSGNWSVARYDGKVGWVSPKTSWLLTPVPATPPTCTPPTTQKKLVTGDTKNPGLVIHSSPELGDSNISGKIEENDLFDLCSNPKQGTAWRVVSYKNTVGWVSAGDSYFKNP